MNPDERICGVFCQACIFIPIGIILCWLSARKEALYDAEVDGMCQMPPDVVLVEELLMEGGFTFTHGSWVNTPCDVSQIEAKYNQQQGEVSQWMKRAELALSKDDEELAREALKRKKTAEDLANNYKVQVDNTKGAVDQLVANVRLIEQKVQDAKAKKSTLQARAATARSSKQIQELVSGIDTGKSALGAFDKMEQKVLSMEAENEAVAQLKAPETSMEDKFKQLEAGSSVDDELAAMKRNLLTDGKEKAGSSSGAKQERSAKDAIDVELEALRKKAQEKA